MPKSFNQGAETREIICPCGFHISGSVREANMKLKLHLKKCEYGKNNLTIPEYNKSNARNNGVLKLQKSNIRHHTNVLSQTSNEEIKI
jgi:hypothetical protein